MGFELNIRGTFLENPLPKRALGSTGESVSLIAIGGFSIGKPANPKVGIKIIRTAIDNGVNFLDNAWCYHEGRSERIMGEALMDGYRDKVILMTKNHGRDYNTYNQQLEDSLERLQTDYIDLVQFHEIIHEGEPEKLFNQGAIDAAIDAKKEGKIRFIGFSGHKWPRLFKEMLHKDFKWDTVQLPLNVLDYHYRSFTKQILPILERRKIGIIGMKSLGGGSWGRILKIKSLYAEECMRYTMSLPISTLVSGIDSMEILKINLKIASNFTLMTAEERNELLARAKPYSKNSEV